MGKSLVHGDPEENNQQKELMLEEQDIVYLRYEKNVLWIEKGGRQVQGGKKNHKDSISVGIVMKLAEAKLKGAYFCCYPRRQGRQHPDIVNKTGINKHKDGLNWLPYNIDLLLWSGWHRHTKHDVID